MKPHYILFLILSTLLSGVAQSDDKYPVSSHSFDGIPGIWLEGKVADVLEANSNPGDEGCSAILESKVDLIRIDDQGNVFMNDPESKQDKKVFTIKNGILVSEPEDADLFYDFQIQISRVGDKLAIDFNRIKEGKVVESTRLLLGSVSPEIASKLGTIKTSCAHAQISGRIANLPINAGRMEVAGDVSSTYEFGEDNGGYVSCSVDNGKLSLFFMQKESESWHGSVGLQTILPTADLASGNEVTIAVPQASMNLPEQRDDYFQGNCSARVKRTKHVLDVILECPEMHRQLNGQDQKVRVTGTYACLANALKRKE